MPSIRRMRLTTPGVDVRGVLKPWVTSVDGALKAMSFDNTVWKIGPAKKGSTRSLRTTNGTG